MKREICALLLLAVLAALSIWNIRGADRLVGEIQEHLDLSEKAMLSGDSPYAEQQLEAALHIWLAARGYTQIFLRHPELDNTTDVFYATLQSLRGGETRALSAAYDRLRYHLDCIDEMEHPGPGSIF